MKNLLAILLFIFVSIKLCADKTNIAFEVMVDQAECIVMGEIISVDSLAYQFSILKTVAGHANNDTITVRKFHIWQCDPRIEYKVGQKSILFLSFYEETYWTINGGDGEIFYQHPDSIYVTDYQYKIHNDNKTRIISQGNYIDSQTFINGIRRFRNCVDFGIGKYKPGVVVRPFRYSSKCKNVAKDNFTENEFYNWLVSTLNNYQRIK